MIDLDELVGRAVESPIASPPDFEHLRARARRHGRRRIVARAAAGVVVFGLTAGALAAFAGGGAERELRVAGPPRPAQTAGGAITRPVLDSCAPATATEGTLTGSGITSPALPGEVFADPARGVAGPLAVLVREPAPAGGGDGKLPGLLPNLTVAGQPANYGAAQPNSGIDWLLPDGAFASIRAKDARRGGPRRARDRDQRTDGPPPGRADLPGHDVGCGELGAEPVPVDDEPLRPGSRGRAGFPHESLRVRQCRVRRGCGGTSARSPTSSSGCPVRSPTSPPAIRQATDAEWNSLLAKTPRPPSTTSVTTTPPR